MIKIIGYGLIMFVFGYLARCIEQAFKAVDIQRYAEQVKTPNETIECTYATVWSIIKVIYHGFVMIT